VTGASGFVGTHMVQHLVSKGYKVTACDLPDSDSGKFAPLGVRFLPCDISRKYTLDGLLEDVDAVMHVAAVYDYAAPWKVLKRVNVKGTRNMAEAAAEQGVKKFVYFSSATIYGDPAVIPADENCKVRPMHNYGESKFLGEREAFKVSVSRGLPATVLRPATIYGAGSTYGAILLINLLYRGALPGIPGDGKTRLHLVHVRDVVNAALFLAKHPESAGREYNIADNTPIELGDLLNAASEELGFKIPKRQIPRFMFESVEPLLKLYAQLTGTKPMYTNDMLPIFYIDHVFETARIRNAGYKLLYPDVRAGFREVLEWYREKRILKENIAERRVRVAELFD